MTLAVLYEFRGMTQEQYGRFIEDAYGGGAMPGVVAHVAGPLEGGWWSFDVYESQEAADAIGPPAIDRLREMGVEQAPTTRTLQVHRVQTG